MVDFFLSYTRDDDAGNLVRDFYTDLREEIWRRTPRRALDAVGFRDVDMPIGTVWDPVTVKALSTCKVFVPLYSPHYFGSESCGKEWWVFTRRRVDDAATHSGIVPVSWESPADFKPHMPAMAGALQRTNERLGDTYRRRGMRHLVQLKNHHSEEYRTVIYELAGMIIAAANESPLADSGDEISFATAVDAFAEYGRRLGDAPVAGHALPIDRNEARHVYFVVAAGTAEEMRALRRTVEQYGALAEDWRPYSEDVSPLVLRACEIAHQQELVPHPQPAGPDLADIVARAADKNQIVVLLVDPWALQVDSYQRLIREYNGAERRRTGALVPWPSDDETAQRSDELVDQVETALDDRLIQPESCRIWLRSVDEFKADLSKMLVQIQSWIRGNHHVPRPAVGDRVIEFPTLGVSAGVTGPGGRP